MKNLGPRLYTDGSFYERERRAVFWNSWQLLGSISHLAAPGDYLAAEISGAKVFAIRDSDGEVRAFRNVCRHRGARLLAEGRGHCNSIRCPYHNWVYGFDGTLERTPWFGKDPGFKRSDWPLEKIDIEIWRGLVFVAIHADQTLKDQLGAVIAELASEPVETYLPVAERRLVFDANWKIYTDNFVEGYHIPAIHRGFFEAVEFDQFETTVHENMVRMTAPARDGLFYRGKWLWMWPNWTLSLFDGGMNTSRINPIGPGRTELLYAFYFSEEAAAGEISQDEIIERNLAVIEEDFEICNEIHKNYASEGYVPGPLSLRHEGGVHWFQSKISQALDLE